MNEYVKAAEQFCKRNGIKITIVYSGMESPEWDAGREVNVYDVYIRRPSRHHSMKVKFYDSLANTWDGKRPSKYDVLACLEKYDVGTIEDFVSEFGYEVNSWNDVKRIERTYKAVVRQYKQVQRVFEDCIDELREIQ